MRIKSIWGGRGYNSLVKIQLSLINNTCRWCNKFDTYKGSFCVPQAKYLETKNNFSGALDLINQVSDVLFDKKAFLHMPYTVAHSCSSDLNHVHATEFCMAGREVHQILESNHDSYI